MMSGAAPARSPACPPPRTAHGFSLLELMLVVAIIGMATTVVLLTLPDGDAALHRQADGFAAHLRRAQETAILGGRTVRVAVEPGGYRFARLDHGQWLPLQEGPFAARTWHDGVLPRMPRDTAQVGFSFDPTGMAEPQALVLDNGRQQIGIRVARSGKVNIDAGTY